MARVAVINKTATEQLDAEPEPQPWMPPKANRKVSIKLQPTEVPPEVPQGEEKSESDEDLEPLPPMKSHKCSCADCGTCCKECWTCIYFPLCCNLSLLTALQILIILDMLIAIVTLCCYAQMHQYDPFQPRTGLKSREDGDEGGSVDASAAAPSPPNKNGQNGAVPSDPDDPSNNIGDLESIAKRYTRIAYYTLKQQQEIEEGCDRNYYVKYLYGDSLIQAQVLWGQMILMGYLSEGIEIFIDISFLITTCCFLSYTSARFYLICIWMLELLPFSIKAWLFIAAWSQSICIFQYGFGRMWRLLDLFRYVHIIPTMLFRVYKMLVFSYLIQSLFTLVGHLTHDTKVLGVTLKEYKLQQRAYLQMTSERDDTSSDELL